MPLGTDAEATAADSSNSIERVIDAAIEEFAENGYSETKLDTISRASGMSKRMIHYHFGDKQGLYQQALGKASHNLTPAPEDLEVDSAVPVEGVRKLIDALYARYVEHPECVRLLTQESVIHSLTAASGTPVADLSAVSLHLDKLLMGGQDSGAFRPGISTNDVFTIIAALSMYRTANHSMMLDLLGVDLADEDNTEGMHRLVVDTVLAFLTSNIPDSGRESYLTTQPAPDEAKDLADIYD